ncbi:MAG: hypothetical protein KAI69_01255 [Deltaproteobacteria bacterium]|nr:hypothetical protein [Deltaproteobacteria bacterium]
MRVLHCLSQIPGTELRQLKLAKQLKRVKEEQFICCHNLKKTLDQTNWNQVFRRVEKVYNEVIHPVPE